MPYKKRAPAKSNLTAAAVKKMIAASKPKARTLRGRGSYSYAKSGRKLGSQIGKMAGNAIGTFADKWLGHGDYTVSKNNLIKPNSVPYIHSADSSVLITHKEYICDIHSQGQQFQTNKFVINPSNSDTFPFLSGIARNFSSYKILGMVFCYKSNSSDSIVATNSTTSLGSVLLATDYSLNNEYKTKGGMLNATFSNSGKPSQEVILHPIECDPNLVPGAEQKFLGTVPSNESSQNYNAGNFYIATDNVNAGNCGGLFVSYSVVLINPRLTVPRGLNIKNEVIYSDCSTVVSETSIFGTSGKAYDGGNTSKITFENNKIYFPKGLSGNYTMCLSWFGGNNSNTSGGTTPTYNNTTALMLFKTANQIPTNRIVGSNTNGSTLIINLAVSITDPQEEANVVFNGVKLPTNLTDLNMVISQVNGNLTGLFEDGTIVQ